MPLLIAVGVLNSERTFPVAFSYVPSENEESFTFFWDSMKAECFISEEELPPTPPPRVILGVNGNAGWTSGRKKRMNVELLLLSGRKPCFLKYL